MKEHPTKRQLLALKFIVDHVATHGYAPSYREIAEGMDVMPNAASQFVAKLRNLGLVSTQPKKNRSLVVTQKGMECARKSWK